MMLARPMPGWTASPTEASMPTGFRFRVAGLLLASALAGGARAAALPAAGSAVAEARVILQTSPLAGFQHYAGRALFALMAPGQPLVLVREPANPFDARAVRVEWYGVQIGYAPRVDNVDLARLMDRGVAVEGRILHLQKSRDPWKRVLMEIYLQDPAGTAAAAR